MKNDNRNKFVSDLTDYVIKRIETIIDNVNNDKQVYESVIPDIICEVIELIESNAKYNIIEHY